MTPGAPPDGSGDERGSRRSFLADVARGAALVTLGGCTRPPERSAYEAMLPADLAQAPATPLRYVAAGEIPAGDAELRGIAIDSADRLYLATAAGVRVLDAAGRAVAAWETPPDVRAVAVGPDGTVYVGLTSRVLRFDASGAAQGGFGEEGAGPGQLRRITSIAAGATHVFVADARNLCVRRFTPAGVFVNDLGRADKATDDQGIVAPSPFLDIALDRQGNVLLGNPGRSRVETWSPDGRRLAVWGQAGLQPDRFCGCCNPTNLALTSQGHVVTAEKSIPRVKVSDTQGRLLAYLPPEWFPAKSAGLDLAVDSRDRIHVAVPLDNVVRVYAPQTAGVGG